jgi:hypothetical protein
VIVVDLPELWTTLPQPTRDWLVEHAGEDLPATVLADLASGSPDAWWLDPSGRALSDAGVDWVEAVANGEQPDPPATTHR